MVFSSLIFLIVFLPIFFTAYFLVPRKLKNTVLFVFSLLFYAWGEPIYIALMLFSTLFDYTTGLIIDKYRSNKTLVKTAMLTSVVVNLGMLGFFKYSNFFVDNLNNIFSLNINFIKIALPVGISFYTFQTMSYVLDLYRGNIGVQKNFISFGAYVSMFPQLIAGPIVVYSNVENEINNRKENIDDFSYGVTRFIEGLGKKVLLANNIGMLWESVKNTNLNEGSIVLYWLGIVAFGLQLYFDFSGYSDMAIGLGKMLGFNFPENFNYPYISKSVTEFWRRWHITLGSWFREYVYIPLGGNRVSFKRWCFNVVIVWFLTGFWHGAGWNFVAWGLYFGLLMVIERIYLIKILEKLPSFVSRIYLLVVIAVSWVFFSLDSFSDGLIYIRNMFGLGKLSIIDKNTLYLMSNYGLILIIGVLFATPLMNNIKKTKMNKVAMYIFYMIVLVVSTAYLVDSTFNPFLYFRF